MRILVLSDLHLEHKPFDLVLPEAGVDVVVLAGDLAPTGDEPRLRKLLRQAASGGQPVIYIAGNHEYYGSNLYRRGVEIRTIVDGIPGVHYLDDSAIQVGAYIFHGTTLWTDFALYGTKDRSMHVASRAINDFTGAIRDGNGFLSPTDVDGLHQQAVAALELTLRQAGDHQVVVVSHFVPSPLSINPKYDGDSCNPYFCSDLGRLMGPRVPLWIHGHTHSAFDYIHPAGTRVVCNPRGYPGENRHYDTAKIVELP